MKKNNENTDVAISSPLTTSGVERMIQVVRGKQVLLDRDLATLYGVETRAINQAVKRKKRIRKKPKSAGRSKQKQGFIYRSN